MDGKPDLQSLGSIWTSDNFKTLYILVPEPIGADQQIGKDLIISAPANTRAEAVKITQALNYALNPPNP